MTAHDCDEGLCSQDFPDTCLCFHVLFPMAVQMFPPLSGVPALPQNWSELSPCEEDPMIPMPLLCVCVSEGGAEREGSHSWPAFLGGMRSERVGCVRRDEKERGELGFIASPSS